MKKLALALALIASPVLAQETKPTLWVMVIQLKASSLNVTYPNEAACEASRKATADYMKKHGLGRADCLPVVQP